VPVRAGDLRDVVGPAGVEQPGSSPEDIRIPERDAGRFALLLLDEQTGKAAFVDVAPMTLEAILRGRARDRVLLRGWLIENIFRALSAIAPDVAPRPPRKILTDYPIELTLERRTDNHGRFIPRWRRSHEEGQGLAEYALIIALIAVIAVVALLFLGTQISDLLNRVGESI
jgi:Flp pilus assembly pilin Flp